MNNSFECMREDRDKNALTYWEQVYATTQSEAMKQKALTMIKIIQERLGETNI